MPTVEVEFYGIARRRAGVPRTRVTAGTVAEALAAVADAFPGLAEVTGNHFRVSLAGERFISDYATPLSDGTCLLVFSADAGG